MTNTKNTLRTLLPLTALLALSACVGPAGQDGIDGMNGEDGENGMNGMDGAEGMDGDTGEDGSNGTDGTNGSDGADGASGADGSDGSDGSDGMNGEDGLSAGNFDFPDVDPGDYYRVDRIGMPAIATALIPSDAKDAYNDDDPVDDAAGAWVSDIVASVDFFHTALDSQLEGLGLSVCATEDCVAAAAPLVVPDTLSINIMDPAGFPNGRALADQAIDITLAVALLDLSVHSVTLLAELPLNPPANDRAFMGSFPFLSAPH
jgi:hypothetical protein